MELAEVFHPLAVVSDFAVGQDLDLTGNILHCLAALHYCIRNSQVVEQMRLAAVLGILS